MPFFVIYFPLNSGFRRFTSRFLAPIVTIGLALVVNSGAALAAPSEPSATTVPVPSMAPVVPDPNGQPSKDQPTASVSPTPSAAVATKDSAPAGTTQFKVTATDLEGLRVRRAPSLTAPIIAKIPEGTIVALGAGVATEADDERWLPVKVDQDTRGWVAARYLVRVQALAPIAKTVGPNASFGEKVAATAAAYIGQPYVWGGNAPGGFDCSGLVQWVYSKTGFEMPRLIPDQLAAGKKVAQSDLRPGDLIAFSNTYRPGLSHVGIFVGNDNFIHAADEARGVMVSSLQEGYWKERYVSAVRLRQ
jgi:cell wall-associated NlpC family hydrolase